MSHFTVLVIGNNPEDQLQPYHEYECTGIEDQYVINVDKTSEVEDWLKEILFVGKTKDGDKIDYHYYEDRATELLTDFKQMPRKEYIALISEDEQEAIDDNFGYKKQDGKYFHYTNPNAKWDWYSLGGRWTGFFKLKERAKGKIGRPGLMTDTAEPGTADQLLKKDIDFAGMRNDRGNKAAARYDLAMKIIGDLPVNESWEKIREENKDVGNARKIYWAQPRCAAWQKERNDEFSYDASPDDFLISREEYIQNARDSATSTYAMVFESKWYGKGRMGWFGVGHDERDQKEWDKEVTALIDSLPDDTLFSLYDCHI